MAARLSRATIKVFKHKDVDDCERICKETENWPGHKLLITDGVFSMDGGHRAAGKTLRHRGKIQLHHDD